MPERVVPFGQLSTEERQRLTRVNWQVRTASGAEITDWDEVKDARYGSLQHVAIINTESGQIYDKVDLVWTPAAFVVVYRKNRDRIEFLLPSERRVLLKDEKGQQGSVFIRNIPQGLIRVWQNETPEQAALREVREETEIEPKSIQKLEDIYFDAANSQVAMPFFLAEVDVQKLQRYQQALEAGEEIKVSEEDWFAIEDIQKLKIQCAKTLSGLLLATGFLGIWPKSK